MWQSLKAQGRGCVWKISFLELNEMLMFYCWWGHQYRLSWYDVIIKNPNLFEYGLWKLWINTFHFIYNKTTIVKLLLFKSTKTAIYDGFSFVTSRDDVIDQKYKKIWKLWINTFRLMYHKTTIVKLLLLKSTKTAIYGGFSFMTSRDDVIDQKCFHNQNFWIKTFHLM